VPPEEEAQLNPGLAAVRSTTNVNASPPARGIATLNSRLASGPPPGSGLLDPWKKHVDGVINRLIEERRIAVRQSPDGRTSQLWDTVERTDLLFLSPAARNELRAFIHQIDTWMRTTDRTDSPPQHDLMRVRRLHDLPWPGLPDQTKETYETMLEQLLKLYTMYRATGATSPMPHFVGPPGCGKSTVFRQLADMLGVNLYTINVSRISPLELEGVQMPDKENTELTLLHNPMWKQLKEGDIVLLDEFLRGFPEVYNGLLDILTSREVAGYKLPDVFIAGASNSTVAYDKALEDRLLHIKVPDPRKSSGERGRLQWMLIDELGLNPKLKGSTSMSELFDTEVLPMFELLDSFDGKGMKASAGAVNLKGTSLRKLIGQAQLRHVTSTAFKNLIEENNYLSNRAGSHQYVFLLTGDKVPAGYESAARELESVLDKLTPVQRRNRELNLQLIEMQRQKSQAKSRDTGEDGSNDDHF